MKNKFKRAIAATVFIVIIILGVVGTGAYILHQNDSKKIYYAQIVQATAAYRLAILDCIQNLGQLNGCDAGTNNIPAPITEPVGPINSLTVIAGVIRVTPVPAYGITSQDDYVVTPVVAENGIVTWKTSGQGVQAGYAR